MQVVVLSSAKDDLRGGCAVTVAEQHSQLGCILGFRDISVDEDG